VKAQTNLDRICHRPHAPPFHPRAHHTSKAIEDGREPEECQDENGGGTAGCFRPSAMTCRSAAKQTPTCSRTFHRDAAVTSQTGTGSTFTLNVYPEPFQRRASSEARSLPEKDPTWWPGLRLFTLNPEGEPSSKKTLLAGETLRDSRSHRHLKLFALIGLHHQKDPEDESDQVDQGI
jgi:hypothetical protein